MNGLTPHLVYPHFVYSLDSIHYLNNLVYQITLSMASWTDCYGLMITCSIMHMASE